MPDLLASLLDHPIVSAAGSALLIALLALWLAGAWWAYRDAARRTESSLAAFLAAGWIVLSTPLLLPLALAIYAYTRPATIPSERRAQALTAELSFNALAAASCSSCRAATEPDWRRCPQCATWLAAACAGCGEWAPAGLQLCPFCGSEPAGVIDTIDLPAGAPAAAPVPVAAQVGHLVTASRSRA